MAGPWEKYANPSTRYGADPVKVREQQLKEEANARANEAAARAAAAAERANANSAQANILAQQRFQADLAQKGLMIGPDGQIVARPEGALGAKARKVDPNRAAQIEGLLRVIKDARAKADDFLAVGKFSGNAAEYPVVGNFLGQNRATLEGITDSIMGDLIQQQVAKLAEVNQGGVTGLANNPEEARRMAASIANLSLDQDLPTFMKGLQRAEDYYRRLALDAGLTEQAINSALGKKQEATARMPDMTGGLPTGTDIQFNYAKPEGGFDRTAWLQANFGISPDQESQITAFMRANRGNPNFSYENLRDYYKAIGAPPPERNDETIKAIREGTANVTGYDSSLAETLYNMALEKRVAERDTTLGAVDTVGRTAANAFFGAGDRVAAAFGPDDYATNLAAQRFETDAAREANPVAAFLGDVGGLAAGTYTQGATANAISGRFLPELARRGPAGSSLARNVLNDTVYGAGISALNGGNPVTGAFQAGIGSGVGNVAGRWLGNTLATSPTITNARNVVGSLLGARQRPVVPQPSRSESMIVNAVEDRGPDAVMNLQDAARLNVPMTLADADPGLQALGGATVRRSPEAWGMAENVFRDRARGQYDRLVGAIDRDLGPTANVPQYSEDLIKQARNQSRPLYEPLESLPPRTSPALDEMLNTNAGMNAMRNATQIADAQRVPAGAMNIGQDAAGNPVFTATPNFQTLNYVKQGFDRSYETLDRAGDPLARSINSLRKDYLAEMDRLYPGYGDARKAYAGPAGEREALQQGQQALRMTPDQVAFTTKDMPQPRLDQFRLGYRSGMVDQAGRVRNNPWPSVYGSPQARQRLGLLFPEGAENFGRQADLEDQLALSRQRITGGSPTAERQLADEAFQGSMAGDIAFDAVTTGAPVKSGINVFARLKKDELGRLGAEKKAKELAPILFDPNAADAARVFEQTMKKAKKSARARGIFGRKAGRSGALIVSAPAVAFPTLTE